MPMTVELDKLFIACRYNYIEHDLLCNSCVMHMRSTRIYTCGLLQAKLLD